MSEVYAEEPEELRSAEVLMRYADLVNVAEVLDDTELSRIGDRVVRECEADEASMSEWKTTYERAQKLIAQLGDRKTFPWDGASNVKLPMITQAAVRFGAEAYGEICRGNEIVKTATPGIPSGNDEAAQERGKRVSEYMNYQLTYEMEEWEPEMDRLLTILPFAGCLHKKTWYDPVHGTNESRLVMPECLVISQDAKSPESARRITEKLVITGNELHERQAAGLYLDVDLQSDGESDDEEFHLLEQHRWLDLDEDGYEEPYIVIVQESSKRVLRIVPRFTEEDILLSRETLEVMRIKARCYFTKYGFIPSLDGKYMDIGWGHLAGPLTEVCNTLVNQLIDAGTMANAPSGFVDSSFKVPEGGRLKFQPGEWKRAKFGVNGQPFLPLPVGEPSNVLFLLLGVMTEMTDNLMAVTDVSLQERAANMPATSVLAMIEQGKKVYSAIHKRVYRSLKSELAKLYALDGVYGDPAMYAKVLNIEAAPEQIVELMRSDFSDDDLDVIPVANPELSSRFQELAQAESLLPVAGMPGADPVAVTKRYVSALRVDRVEEIVPPPNEAVEMHQSQMAQGRMALEAKQLDVADQALTLGLVKNRAEADEMIGKAMRERAEAMAAVEAAERAAKREEADTAKAEADAELRALEVLDYARFGNPARIDKSNSN